VTLNDFAAALHLAPYQVLAYLARNPQVPAAVVAPGDVVTFDDDEAAAFVSTYVANGWRPAQDPSALSHLDFASMAASAPGPHYSPRNPVGDGFLDD
jgi:hypothetical protein